MCSDSALSSAGQQCHGAVHKDHGIETVDTSVQCAATGCTRAVCCKEDATDAAENKEAEAATVMCSDSALSSAKQSCHDHTNNDHGVESVDTSVQCAATGCTRAMCCKEMVAEAQPENKEAEAVVVKCSDAALSSAKQSCHDHTNNDHGVESVDTAKDCPATGCTRSACCVESFTTDTAIVGAGHHVESSDQVCVDSATWKFRNGKFCNWVGAKFTKKRCKKVSEQGQHVGVVASVGCPKTCGAC